MRHIGNAHQHSREGGYTQSKMRSSYGNGLLQRKRIWCGACSRDSDMRNKRALVCYDPRQRDHHKSQEDFSMKDFLILFRQQGTIYLEDWFSQHFTITLLPFSKICLFHWSLIQISAGQTAACVCSLLMLWQANLGLLGSVKRLRFVPHQHAWRLSKTP